MPNSAGQPHQLGHRQLGRIHAEQRAGQHGPGRQRRRLDRSPSTRGITCLRHLTDYRNIDGMAQHHGARRGRPARRPAERAAAGQRHGHPGAAGRAAPHRQPAQRHLGGGGVVLGRADHRRRGVDRPVVELPDRLRADGPDVRPLRHPHARGGAQAPLHQQALERLDRQVGRRLPRLHAGAALPAGALRPPQGRVRPGRARHRVLRALPVHAPGAARAGSSATPSGSAGGRTSSRWSRTRCTSRSAPSASPSSASRRCCGRPCGPPPAAGGSTRSCGGCPG